jgi:PAS domain-containing protein
MSFRGTFLIALITLFVIPLAIFMGHSIDRAGALSAWAGLLLGSMYGACSLGVCYILLCHWEKRMRIPPQLKEEVARPLENPQFSEEKVDLPPPDVVEAQVGSQAQVILRDCIRKAAALPCMGRGSGRLASLNLESSAIELRGLFDALSHESSAAVILLYSQEEARLLFASEAVQSLFGWSAERFCQRFFTLLTNSKEEWQQALHRLAHYTDVVVPLVIQSKTRESSPVESAWGVIRSGSFQGLVVGVLMGKGADDQ